MVRKKRIVIICTTIFLIIIAFFLLYIGNYYNNLSEPKNILGTFIDNISNNIIELNKFNSKYNLGDNFSITGNMSFDLASEKYLPNSINIEDLEKYNLINNLNNSKISYAIAQDKDNKELFLEARDTIGTEDIFYNKYLIENSTKYYFVSKILSTYINNGSSNYFENINNEYTTKDNIDYLYNFIIKSLKNNINEKKISKTETNISINGKDTSTYQISYTINDTEIRTMLSNILNDLKKDNKADTILTNIDENFHKRKISDNKIFLSKKECFVLNIFVDKRFSNPLEYQLVKITKGSKNVLSYVLDNKNKRTITYINDDTMDFIGYVNIAKNSISINFNDNNNKDIGTLKYNKNSNGFNFNLLFNYNNKSYDIVFSSKFIKYSKSGYTNEVNSSFKYLENNINILNGNIKAVTKIKRNVKIREDISNAVLNSSLNKEQIAYRDNLYNNIVKRLKNVR